MNPAKLIIAILLIGALIAAYVMLTRKLNGKEAKKPAPAKASKQTGVNEKTTQDLLPLADFTGPVMVMRDGTAASVVKVKCKNYTLLSADEKVRAAQDTATVISSQPTQPMKIIHIQRPVDSTESVNWMKSIYEHRKTAMLTLGDSIAEKDTRNGLARRNEMLARLIRDETAGGEGQIRTRADAYMVLPVAAGPANERSAFQRAQDMANVLQESGFSASILYQVDLLKLLSDYLGNYRTQSENFDPYAWTPVFTGVAYNKENDDETESEDTLIA